MNRLFTTLLAIIGCFIVISTDAQERSISALKINSTLKIDGHLDEAIWKEAAIADSFILNSPQFGIPASQRSTVRILYNDQAIYIGAYLFDDPKLIRKQLTSRDGEQRNDVDYFQRIFDTYNDDQNGFQFLVTTRTYNQTAVCYLISIHSSVRHQIIHGMQYGKVKYSCWKMGGA